MTPVEILERAKCANRRIAQISAERAQLEQELQTLKSFDYSKPVVRSSGGRGEIEANAVRIADRERQLEDELQRQLEYRHNAMVLIAALPSLKERVILFHRYILGEKWTPPDSVLHSSGGVGSLPTPAADGLDASGWRDGTHRPRRGARRRTAHPPGC